VKIDLHAHSTVSDGTDTPIQLVRKAAEAELDVVALTDHDSSAGWDDAVRTASRSGVCLIRGAEFTCLWQGVAVHMLSYLHEPAFPPLVEELHRVRQARLDRARVMVEMVAQDFPITWEDVVAQTGPGAAVGRPHVADALVAAGVAPNRTAAFKEILHSRSPYCVRHYSSDAIVMVEIIRAAGGVPVFAHPGAIHRQRLVGDQAIMEMAEAGLAGLEVYHRDNPAPQRARLLALAEQLDLLVTGSSDYHGEGKANRLGENTTPLEVLLEIVAQGELGPAGADKI